MKEQLDALTRAITACFPDMRIVSARIVESGQNNSVLMVNEDMVFRFPRYAAGAERLRMEAAILRAVVGRVGLAVPDPAFSRLDGHDGPLFMGYRSIPGEPLLPRRLEKCDARRVAEQLAAFLSTLHATPVASVAAHLPPDEGTAKWARMYDRIRELLFPHMRPDARAAVAAHFEAYLGTAADAPYVPTLIHGDFGPGNILFDSANGTVTGVIDFGSAGLGDPATDIAALSGYGEGFIRMVLERYPLDAGGIDRVRFYRGTFALQEALFGIENGDEGAFAAGMANYR